MENNLQSFFKRNEKVIGTIASILAIVMFIALIEVLLANLSGASNIFIQPLATSVNGLFWSMYAYGRKDWFLLVPNILACVLGAVTAVTAFV